MEPQMSARERYERGQMLKQMKMYDRALDDFRHAARDPLYAGKAYAQLALCFRAMGRHEDAADNRHQRNRQRCFCRDTLQKGR